MKQFLITVAGVLVGLLLFAGLTPFILLGVVAAAARPTPTPARTVLLIDLRGALTDQASRNPFALLSGRTQSVMGIEQTLRQAENDERVRGVFVRLPETGMAPAAADELREAFKAFHRHGKFVIAHSQGLYAAGAIASTYELAASAGELWMQPGSAFQVTGMANEDLFFKRAFDRFGVVADFQQRYEYKNAVNPYLYDDYTPAHRTAELGWMTSVYASALQAAAADRSKPFDLIKTTLEAGPYSAEEAKSKGLVDRIGLPQEAEAAALAQAGDGAKLVDIADYKGNGFADRTGPKIAVISAEGAIMTGPSGGASPLGGESAIRSDEVAKAFYRAIDDSQVRAIVFRLSSPGGSDSASEQILAAVRAARAAGKPVVVSMGVYGASGGYWVSSDANAIVAEPTTLTGSIGVFGGKLVIGPALAKFGVDMRGLSVGGPFASSGAGGQPMSAQQHAVFSNWMDRIYNGFVGRVAEGRHLPVDKVAAIARGRVWTGAQAAGLGLVDQLGGFYDAVDRAKALAHIQGDARLVAFDGGTTLEALQRLFGGQTLLARIGGGAYVADDVEARALVGALGDARLRAKGAMVLAPMPRF